jgi:hypothetical protein
LQASLGGSRIYSLAELNAAINELLKRLNDERPYVFANPLNAGDDRNSASTAEPTLWLSENTAVCYRLRHSGGGPDARQ